MSRYLIIGGGVVGGRACQGIRKVDMEGRVAVIAGEKHLPYQRPPLSKGYLMGKHGLDRVYIKDAAFYAENHIDLIQGVRATQVDRAAHSVHLEDGQILPCVFFVNGVESRHFSPARKTPGCPDV